MDSDLAKCLKVVEGKIIPSVEQGWYIKAVEDIKNILPVLGIVIERLDSQFSSSFFGDIIVLREQLESSQNFLEVMSVSSRLKHKSSDNKIMSLVVIDPLKVSIKKFSEV